MINTILKTDKKENTISIESLLNDVYLLPKWEKIKDIVLHQNKFFFKRSINAGLFRKFSSKNSVEKYSLRDSNNNVLGFVDLRVYKDSVYIINMNVESNINFEQISNLLLQTAVEKALYNTTEKQLKINLCFSALFNNRLRKIMMSEDFVKEESQTLYEKEMFGETFMLNVESSSFWQKKIKQIHILINK